MEDYVLVSNTDRLTIKIDSISINLTHDKEMPNTENSQHFSIREYVSQIRKKDRQICVPFCLDEECTLPPLNAAKFKWCYCENCMREICSNCNSKSNGMVPNLSDIGYKSSSITCHQKLLSILDIVEGSNKNVERVSKDVHGYNNGSIVDLSKKINHSCSVREIKDVHDAATIVKCNRFLDFNTDSEIFRTKKHVSFDTEHKKVEKVFDGVIDRREMHPPVEIIECNVSETGNDRHCRKTRKVRLLTEILSGNKSTTNKIIGSELQESSLRIAKRNQISHHVMKTNYIPSNKIVKTAQLNDCSNKLVPFEDADADEHYKTGKSFFKSTSGVFEFDHAGTNLSLGSYSRLKETNRMSRMTKQNKTNQVFENEGLHVMIEKNLSVAKGNVGISSIASPSDPDSSMNGKQNLTSRSKDATFPLMQQKDSLAPYCNGKSLGLQGQFRDYQTANGVSERVTSDDVPMEIVELMAKNQYERFLHNPNDNFQAIPTDETKYGLFLPSIVHTKEFKSTDESRKSITQKSVDFFNTNRLEEAHATTEIIPFSGNTKTCRFDRFPEVYNACQTVSNMHEISQARNMMSKSNSPRFGLNNHRKDPKILIRGECDMRFSNMNVTNPETIPAMHLLSLLDPGVQSYKDFTIERNQSFQNKDSFSQNHYSKDIPGPSYKTRECSPVAPVCRFQGKRSFQEKTILSAPKKRGRPKKSVSTSCRLYTNNIKVTTQENMQKSTEYYQNDCLTKPKESIHESMICSINRNPADFSIPEAGNMYMTRAEDFGFGLVNTDQMNKKTI